MKSRLYRLLPLSVFLVTAIACFLPAAVADVTPPSTDGWYSWRIEAPDAAPSICCAIGSRDHRGCDLESGDVHYAGGCAPGSREQRIFVLQRNGKPSDIRLLSAGCEVRSGTEIVDIGIIPTDTSVLWLRRIVEDMSLTRSVREDALFVLAQSGVDIAYEYLDMLLSKR